MIPKRLRARAFAVCSHATRSVQNHFGVSWLAASVLGMVILASSQLCGAQPAGESPQSLTNATAPLSLTAAQDHQLMMDALHITSLRRGADGNNPQSPYFQNTNE